MSRLARVGDGERATGRLAATEILAVLAFFITALSWPFPNRAPTTGLDPSWHIALHLAASMDLRQGVDMVFTYGPLGFLSIPNSVHRSHDPVRPAGDGHHLLRLVAILLIEARESGAFVGRRPDRPRHRPHVRGVAAVRGVPGARLRRLCRGPRRSDQPADAGDRSSRSASGPASHRSESSTSGCSSPRWAR